MISDSPEVPQYRKVERYQSLGFHLYRLESILSSLFGTFHT